MRQILAFSLCIILVQGLFCQGIKIDEKYLLDLINKDYKSVKKELEYNSFNILEDPEYNFNYPTIHVYKNSKHVFSISTEEDASTITGFAVLSSDIFILKQSFPSQNLADFKSKFPEMELCLDDMSGNENFYFKTYDSVRKLQLLYLFEVKSGNSKQLGKYPTDENCTKNYSIAGTLSYIQVLKQI
jgi:hypothetical protein